MVGSLLTENLLLIGNVIKNLVTGGDATDIADDIVSKGKITRLIKKFIITPSIIVDDSLKYMDQKEFKKIITTEMAVFTGIVVESIRILVEMYGVEPSYAIQKINSPEDIEGIIRTFRRARSLVAGTESLDNVSYLLSDTEGLPLLIGTEDSGRDAVSVNRTNKIDSINFNGKDTDSFFNVYELQLDLTTKDGHNRVLVIPLIITPNIMFTNADTLIGDMIQDSKGISLKERLLDYQAGAISLFNLVFATDLVKRYKENKVRNISDVTHYLNYKDKTAAVSDIFYNESSFNKNFNIYLFNADKERIILKNLRGSFYKDRYKDILTDKLAAFSVSFVDSEEETLTMLIDSLPGFSTVSFKMLSEGGKSNDIKDIIKGLLNNKQPF